MKQMLLKMMSTTILSLIFTSCIACECKSDEITAFANNHKMKQARLKAANKKRIFFNDDGCDLGRIVEDYSAEDVVKARQIPFLGTDITTVSFSITDGDAPLYNSKIQPLFGEAHVHHPQPFLQKIGPNIQTLRKKGLCAAQIMLEFNHKNNLEFFASLRMNDVHDRLIPGWITKWKVNHSQFVVDNTVVEPEMELYLTSQDFTHQEVRDRKFEVIEEITKNYDIDALELDFIRHPVMFTKTLRGLPVTKDEVEIINNFMRRIRKLTDEVGEKRGRPVLVAVRVPQTFEICKNIGMDLKTWIKEDLIDILISGGGYSPFSTSVEDLIKFAHKYKVPLYPWSNQASTVAIAKDKDFWLTLNGLLSNWYRAGADGVYLFNIATAFEQKYGQELIDIRNRQYKGLNDVDDPSELIGKDKIFGVDIEKDKNTSLAYYKFMTPPSPLPISLKGPVRHGLIRHIPITIGDDINEAKEKGFSAKATLIVKANGLADASLFDFIFNGEPLKEPEFTTLDEKKQQYKYEIDIAPSKLRVGKNWLAVWAQYRPKTEKPVEIYSIIIKLDYKKM